MHYGSMKQHSQASIKTILFVCRGNICRSPIAEGTFRHIAMQRGFVDHFHVESAGLSSWHIGKQPDLRAQDAMRSLGIDISHIRARRISPEDFETFDLILAMDRWNRNNLLRLAPAEHRDKIRLLLSYAPNLRVQEVPDMAFRNTDGVEYICQLIDAACRFLFVRLTAAAHSLPVAKPGFSVPVNG